MILLGRLCTVYDNVVGNQEKGYYICSTEGEKRIVAVFRESEQIEMYYGIRGSICKDVQIEEASKDPYRFKFYIDKDGDLYAFLAVEHGMDNPEIIRTHKKPRWAGLKEISIRVIKGEGLERDTVYHSHKWMKDMRTFGWGKSEEGDDIILQSDSNNEIIKIDKGVKNCNTIRFKRLGLGIESYRGSIRNNDELISVDNYRYTFEVRKTGDEEGVSSLYFRKPIDFVIFESITGDLLAQVFDYVLVCRGKYLGVRKITTGVCRLVEFVLDEKKKRLVKVRERKLVSIVYSNGIGVKPSGNGDDIWIIVEKSKRIESLYSDENIKWAYKHERYKEVYRDNDKLTRLKLSDMWAEYSFTMSFM
jgi:hypothetical protein